MENRSLIVRDQRLVRDTSSSHSDESADSEFCPICNYTGVEVVPGKGARTCVCVRVAAVKGRLAIVPPIFNEPRLERLEPMPDLHVGQTSVIEYVKANPAESYLLTGLNRTGKSHIGWALYRRAVELGRGVVACKVRHLLKDFQILETAETGSRFRPRITAETLAASTDTWTLWLDEAEKARPSEFAAEQLFDVLDATKSFKHQLLIASNYPTRRIEGINKPTLGAHWGRVSETWGSSIMTRMESCNLVEFF